MVFADLLVVGYKRRDLQNNCLTRIITPADQTNTAPRAARARDDHASYQWKHLGILRKTYEKDLSKIKKFW